MSRYILYSSLFLFCITWIFIFCMYSMSVLHTKCICTVLGFKILSATSNRLPKHPLVPTYTTTERDVKSIIRLRLTLLAQTEAAYATASFLFRAYVSSSRCLYLSVSPSSLAKLLTVFMEEKVSVATWLALARDSWTLAAIVWIIDKKIVY